MCGFRVTISSMHRYFAYLWLRIKEAFPGNAGAANDWQWVVANPLWQSIGAAICSSLGAFLAAHWREAPMMSIDTMIGTLLGGFFGCVVTWLIVYCVRFIKAPSILYYREKDRADVMTERIR